jgi:hypothetical protein
LTASVILDILSGVPFDEYKAYLIQIMTDEEVLNFYNELVEYYGDKLPNFEHEPRQFAYLVKLYRYYKSR